MINTVTVNYCLTTRDYRKLLKLRLPFEVKRLGGGRLISLLILNPVSLFLIFTYGYFKKRAIFRKKVIIQTELDTEKIVTTVLQSNITNYWKDVLHMRDLGSFFTIDFEKNAVVLPKANLSSDDIEKIQMLAQHNQILIQN